MPESPASEAETIAYASPPHGAGAGEHAGATPDPHVIGEDTEWPLVLADAKKAFQIGREYTEYDATIWTAAYVYYAALSSGFLKEGFGVWCQKLMTIMEMTNLVLGNTPHLQTAQAWAKGPVFPSARTYLNDTYARKTPPTKPTGLSPLWKELADATIHVHGHLSADELVHLLHDTGMWEERPRIRNWPLAADYIRAHVSQTGSRDMTIVAPVIAAMLARRRTSGAAGGAGALA